MQINIKSYFGKYVVKEINDFNKNHLSQKNNFYLIDKKVYKKFLINKINGKILLIDSNEKNKSYFEIGLLIKKIVQKGIRRNSTIIAVGGGIVQDISGFIASILFRGIDWYFYPTTLLSQGDSCIGGKTSINFGNAKNQIGNFYPPKKIFLYSEFLKGLKKREIMSGLGELAHYYLVSKKTDWRYYNLTLNNYLLNPSNYNILRSIAFKSLLIKKKFIERDEFDTGYRLIQIMVIHLAMR